jgi:hypothetical protein
MPDQDAARVLVPGEPPLTESMASRFAAFLGWVLEIPLTPEDRQRVRLVLIQDWTQKKQADIASTVSFLEVEAEATRRAPRERQMIRERLQAQVIGSLRGDKGSADSRWLVSLYEAAHPPLAPGNPPLTRKISDALLEYYAFTLREADLRHLTPDQALKDAWAASLASKYASFPAKDQQAIARAPMDLADLRVAWANASVADRKEAAANWKRALAKDFPCDPVFVGGEKALARLTELGKRDRATLSAADLLRGAADLEAVARALRKEGGEANLRGAEQMEQMSRQFRRAANQGTSAAAPTRPRSSDEAYAAAMRQLQSRHNTFISLMNMNTMRWVSNMNIAGNIGGRSDYLVIRPGR